jgi:hypothetical protein
LFKYGCAILYTYLLIKTLISRYICYNIVNIIEKKGKWMINNRYQGINY